MSLFFLSFTVLTLGLSHFWAKRSRPKTPTSFTLQKSITGDLQSFHKQLERVIHDDPQLLLLEKTKNRFVISQSPSLFDFGHFYFIQVEEKENQLQIQLQIQAKLVSGVKTHHPKVDSILAKIEAKNVG